MQQTTDTDMSVGAAIAEITITMDLTADQRLFLTYKENVNLEHEYGGNIDTL